MDALLQVTRTPGTPAATQAHMWWIALYLVKLTVSGPEFKRDLIILNKYQICSALARRKLRSTFCELGRVLMVL